MILLEPWDNYANYSTRTISFYRIMLITSIGLNSHRFKLYSSISILSSTRKLSALSFRSCSVFFDNRSQQSHGYNSIVTNNRNERYKRAIVVRSWLYTLYMVKFEFPCSIGRRVERMINVFDLYVWQEVKQLFCYFLHGFIYKYLNELWRKILTLFDEFRLIELVELVGKYHK